MGTTITATRSNYMYWDEMDGVAMVCSRLGPSEYQAFCLINRYVIGVILTIDGVVFMYNAKRLGQLENAVASTSDNLLSKKIKMQAKQRTRSAAKRSYAKRVTYVVGFDYVCIGFIHLLGGNGTVHATSTVAGIFSDFVLSIIVACGLYHSLLQLRGAESFRNLVQLPTHSVSKCIRVKYVLDIIQSAGAVPMMLGVWLLLATSTISRSEFYSTISVLMGVVGVRSLFENILDRVRTLGMVDILQQKAGGDIIAKRRRRNILKKKARTLVIDMVLIFTMNVLAPASWIIFGTVNSSTQWLIHQGTNEVIMSVAMTMLCVTTHKHVNHSFQKLKRTNTLMTQKSSNGTSDKHSKKRGDKEYTVADESGLSVVGESEVAVGGKKRSSRVSPGENSLVGSPGSPESPGRGLFSDVESNV